MEGGRYKVCGLCVKSLFFKGGRPVLFLLKPAFSKGRCLERYMYVCMYVCMCLCVCVCIYIPEEIER